MEKEQLIKIINKIKEYDLSKYFENQEEFKKWLISLSTKQINNLLGLNIKKEELEIPKELLINVDLLNCDDYNNRVKALSNLHNGDGCWHLFDVLVAPNFLKSTKWYKDIETISHAEEVRYALWVIGNDVFINSPYHDEDLELIINAKDNALDTYGRKKQCDFAIAEALSETAICEASINSKYHHDDMNMIANAGSNKVGDEHSYPKSGIGCLARNIESLNDPHHAENMKILFDSKLKYGANLIYNLFTNPNVINSKYYNKIRKAVSNIEEDITSLALYSYIINFNYIDDFNAKEIIREYDLHFKLPNGVLTYYTQAEKDTLKNINSDFLEYISLIRGPISLYISYLLSKDSFINSPSMKEDLDFIINNFSSNCDYNKLNFIIEALIKSVFANSPYHKSDLAMISSGSDKETIFLLMSCATNIDNVKSPNHEYDMKYILSLTGKNLNNKMREIIFEKNGINNPKHVNCLEKLIRDEDISEDIFASVDDLYQYIEEPTEKQDKPQTTTNNYSNKILQKVRKIFKSRL